MKLLLFFTVVCTLGITMMDCSPCTSHKILPFMEKRDVTEGNHGICDSLNIPASGEWFKVEGQQMLTNESLVSLLTCGTQAPIWLKFEDDQKFPENYEEMQWFIACIPSPSNMCSTTLPVAIRNCGRYNEYFLNQPQSCDVAYCFTYGEYDKPPSQKVDTPIIEKDLEEKASGGARYQALILRCPLNSSSFDLQKYLYHILWTNETDIIFSSKIVEYADRHLTHLRVAENPGDDGLKRLGAFVKCIVRMKHFESINGPFGPSSESDSVFLGIKILNPTIELIEGTSLTEAVLLEPTIPIPCYGYPYQCSIQVRIVTKKSECNPIKKIQRQTSKNDVQIDGCRFHISNENWNKTSNFNISWGNSGKYTAPPADLPNGYFIVQLETIPAFNTKLWDNYELPPIYVRYRKQPAPVWEGKQCYAVNDPHMRTFNQRKYENQNPGIFILYIRETDLSYPIQSFGNFDLEEALPVEYYGQAKNNFVDVVFTRDSGRSLKKKCGVDIETTKCNSGNHAQPYCVCGMAVRVGKDLFVINRCEDTVVEFRFCNDGLIDVRKLGDYIYKIYLPTGTTIDVSLIDYTGVRTMNVFISPTAEDIEKSGGLCDKLNSDASKIFTLRSGQPTDEATLFVDSWEITKEESMLYVHDASKLGSWSKEELYCDCTDGNIIGNCSYENVMSCERSESDVVSNGRCVKKTLQKQYLRHTPKFKPKMKKQFRVFKHSDVEEKIISSFSLQWTEETALQYCKEYMNASDLAMLCSHIPSIDFNGTLRNCVADILLTNETIWAIDARENLRLSCMKEIKQNTTLSENGTSEFLPMIEEIKKLACPNECSGNGLCNDGECICKDGYGASDCSYDLSIPPDLYSIDIGSGDICDIKNCEEVFIEGDGFLKTSTLSCRLQQFYITSNMTFRNKDIKFVKGNHNTIAEVQCPVPQPVIAENDPDIEEVFIHGYEISVSNTGKDYSISRPLFILDTTCQVVTNISGDVVFVLKENYCFINGNCVQHGTIDGSNKCRHCQTNLQKFSWSWIHGCGNSAKNNLWIIGAVLGGLALFASIFGLLLLVIKHKRPRVDVFTNEMAIVTPSSKN